MVVKAAKQQRDNVQLLTWLTYSHGQTEHAKGKNNNNNNNIKSDMEE